MSMMTFVLFTLGLAFLVGGAELLVRGASRLATQLGVAPLIVGLTVVAFGTSAPEMAVSVQSAASGGSGAHLAIGNIVGSNIFNVLFILGLSAIITPLVVAQQLVRIEVPLGIGLSLLVWIMAGDGYIGRLEGLLLFAGIVAYTVFAIIQGRKESAAVQEEYDQEYGTAPRGWHATAINLSCVAAGLILLVLGSNWLIDGAIAIARAFGVGELIIGLTIVAAGTSLPEVATSVMASIKGERDIAVGNVVGSGIFNLLAVLGMTALVTPQGVPVAPAALNFDIPVMIAVSVACLPIFFTGYTIARWEGFLFLAYYLAYTAYLILSASGHDALPAFSGVMLGFVLPLTLITLFIGAARQLQRGSRPS